MLFSPEKSEIYFISKLPNSSTFLKGIIKYTVKLLFKNKYENEEVY